MDDPLAVRRRPLPRLHGKGGGVVMPPMLACRRQRRITTALLPAERVVAGLRTEMAWVKWLCANDPEEPKLGWRWVA